MKNSFTTKSTENTVVHRGESFLDETSSVRFVEICLDCLDKKWRAQTKLATRPFIDSVLSRPLSRYLRNVKIEGRGLYTEIFVMDNKGMNVGQNDVTSDYWQGDEAKWLKTFLAGPNGVFIDHVEADESTQQFQSQISISIVDSATNIVIGAVTVGIDIEALLQGKLYSRHRGVIRCA